MQNNYQISTSTISLTFLLFFAQLVVMLIQPSLLIAKQPGKITLTAAEKRWLSEHTKLRVGYDPFWPPYEYIDNDGNYTGLISDYFQLIKEQIPLDFQMQKTGQWGDYLKQIAGKKIDFLSGLTRNSERAKIMLFSKPFACIRWVIVTGKADKEFKDLSSLSGIRTGVVKDYISHNTLKNKHPQIPHVTFPDTLEVLKAVNEGEIPAGIVMEAAAFPLIHANIFYNVKVTGSVFGEGDLLRFGIRKDWPELVSILNKCLENIPAKERDRIHRKWMSVPIQIGGSIGLPWIILEFILAIILLLLIIFFLWSRHQAVESAQQQRPDEKLLTHSAAITAAANGIVITDKEGKILWTNPGFTRLTGYSAEEARDSELGILKSGKHPDEFYVGMWDTILSGKIWHGEIINRKKDGILYEEEMTITPVLDEAGEITHFVSIKQDISARKKAEEHLELLNQLVYGSLNSAAVGAWWIDFQKDSNSFYTLNNTAALLGLTANSDMEQPYKIELWTGALKATAAENPEYGTCIEETLENFSAVINAKSEIFNATFPIKLPDGKIRWLIGRANISKRDSAGKALFLTGTIIDITEQKTTEQQQIKDTEKRLALALESGKIGTFYLNFSTDELTWDKRTMEIFGVPEEEFKGEHADWVKCLHPDDRAEIEKHFNACLENQSDWDYVYRILKPDEDERYIHAKAKITYDEGTGEPIELSGIHIDVTEEIQKELAEAKEKVEAVATARDEILANMSYEVRIPLNAVLGFLGLSLKDPILPENHRQNLQIASDSVKGLLSLINDIHDMGKLGAGKLATEEKPFNLAQMLEETVKILELKTREKGLELEHSIHPELTGNFYGDPFRLRQIIVNLANNAVRFTERGKVSINVTPGNKKDMLQFTIADTGIGISPERIDNIFYPRTLEDDSSTGSFEGTGFGTTIASQLLELMHGRIWVESEPGMGSKFHFTVRMPATEAKDEMQADEMHRLLCGTALPCKRRCFKILLAEDIDANMTLATIRLQQYGHTVVPAKNGREAVTLFRKGEIDLILMDLQMPEMDGLEATRRIRDLEAESEKHIPIIALTSGVLKEKLEKYSEAGVDATVEKPMDFPELFVLIENLAPEGLGDMIIVGPPEPTSEPEPEPEPVDEPEPTQEAEPEPGPETEQPEPESEVEHLIEPEAPAEPAPVSLPGIDFEKGLASWQEQKMYLDALKGFTMKHKDVVDKLSVLIEKGDLEGAYRITHALKGLSENLAMTELFTIIEDVDTAVIARKTDRAKELLTPLRDALDTVISSISMLTGLQEGKENTVNTNLDS
ncbi:PAS domain-containing protein [Candidatus Riflebacteria bacterium]